MELIVPPDLVGPCPLSEPEDEASSSPGPAKGEPSVLGPGASQGAVPSKASQGAKRHAVETPVKYVPKNGGRARHGENGDRPREPNHVGHPLPANNLEADCRRPGRSTHCNIPDSTGRQSPSSRPTEHPSD